MGRGLDVKAYDLLYRGDLKGSAAEGDVGFFVRMAARTGGPVLELGCGTGRITFPLARAGLKVTGLDISPSMLEIARRKALALPLRLRPRFGRADMSSFLSGPSSTCWTASPRRRASRRYGGAWWGAAGSWWTCSIRGWNTAARAG